MKSRRAIEAAVVAAVDGASSSCARPKGRFLAADLEAAGRCSAELRRAHRAAPRKAGRKARRRLVVADGSRICADALTDPAALAQEVVRFVARSDVDEEIVRMRGHIEHWQTLAARRRAVRPQARLPAAGDEPRDQYDRLEGRGDAGDRNRHRGQGRARAAAGAGPECRVARGRCAGSCSSCPRRPAPERPRSSSGWWRSARSSSARARTRPGRRGRARRTESTIIL